MADNSDFEQAEPANGDRAMEIFMDFQARSVIEASNALVKSVPFYLAIVGVIIGYVLTQQLGTNTKLIFLSIGIVVSVSYCVAIALVGWGAIKGLDIIAQTMRAISQTAYEKANMPVFVRRGKFVTVACILCVYFVLIIFIAGMSFFMRDQASYFDPEPGSRGPPSSSN